MALKENTKIDQIAYKPKPYRIKNTPTTQYRKRIQYFRYIFLTNQPKYDNFDLAHTQQ